MHSISKLAESNIFQTLENERTSIYNADQWFQGQVV